MKVVDGGQQRAAVVRDQHDVRLAVQHPERDARRPRDRDHEGCSERVERERSQHRCPAAEKPKRTDSLNRYRRRQHDRLGGQTSLLRSVRFVVINGDPPVAALRPNR